MRELDRFVVRWKCQGTVGSQKVWAINGDQAQERAIEMAIRDHVPYADKSQVEIESIKRNFEGRN
jgi:hypothetical protein